VVCAHPEEETLAHIQLKGNILKDAEMSLLEHKKLGFCELKDLKPLQWSSDIIHNYEDISNSVVNDVQEINRFIKNYWLCQLP
jgi:hypothetical protein